MRNIPGVVRTAVAVTASLAFLTLVDMVDSRAYGQEAPAARATKPRIVLVHGAWADGSSWAAVTAKLQAEGFVVDVVPNPLRGVASDARYLKDYLATITGPIVLVGHSYAGMVITSAASGNANVKALVYVDAFIPKHGDTVGELAAAQPGSGLDPKTTINAVPIRDVEGKVVDTDLYIKPSAFPALFAGGIAADVAAELGANQRPETLSSLSEKFAGVPAWETIPSWALVGTEDRVIPPSEQQIMADRARAHVVKVPAPHLSMITAPDAVADLIATASKG